MRGLGRGGHGGSFHTSHIYLTVAEHHELNKKYEHNEEAKVLDVNVAFRASKHLQMIS